ncbi:WD repeat-containing protein 76 [Senna tora]|uniref:WD repeat-containing protein 76 n=1 Tax=Senna tora TaxID=362788 RepID=A0A834W5E3_9FABA|nr:WD repeat-containing protein 76 [Senna tora]
MAPQKLNEYERKRLENIRRNDEMMAALKIHSKASEVSAAAKRSRVGTKSYTVKSEKKPKTETPVVIRRSLRTRGMPPDSEGLNDSVLESANVVEIDHSAEVLGPLAMSDAYSGDGSTRSFVEAIVGLAKKEESVGGSCDVEREEDEKVCGSLKLESLTLDSENIARVVLGRITIARIFPSSSAKMIVAGNKYGNIGFWDFDCSKNEGSEIHLYSPHPAPISGILVQRHCLSKNKIEWQKNSNSNHCQLISLLYDMLKLKTAHSATDIGRVLPDRSRLYSPSNSIGKIYTSCYEGFVRLMDAEKEVFDLVYRCDKAIYSLSQPENDANCLYFGKDRGGLAIWDIRMSKCSSQLVLHEERINTIDFNSKSPHIMATSSSDGTACTWDLRYNKKDKLKALRTFTHRRAVHSAYFSPSGCSLATTSADNTIGIYSGANWENASSIYHYNQTGRWLSSFRAIWGWDDSYVFVGNMKRGVDVVSPVDKRIIKTLQSPHISAIPCRFDAHPCEMPLVEALEELLKLHRPTHLVMNSEISTPMSNPRVDCVDLEQQSMRLTILRGHGLDRLLWKTSQRSS